VEYKAKNGEELGLIFTFPQLSALSPPFPRPVNSFRGFWGFNMLKDLFTRPGLKLGSDSSITSSLNTLKSHRKSFYLSMFQFHFTCRSANFHNINVFSLSRAKKCGLETVFSGLKPGPKPTPPFSVIATPFWAQKKQCEKMEPRKIEDVFKAGTQTILADWGWPRGVVFFWGERGQGVATI